MKFLVKCRNYCNNRENGKRSPIRKYFARIVFMLNLKTDKTVGLIVKSREEQNNPTNYCTKI